MIKKINYNFYSCSELGINKQFALICGALYLPNNGFRIMPYGKMMPLCSQSFYKL